jgi:hypothetical protein
MLNCLKISIILSIYQTIILTKKRRIKAKVNLKLSARKKNKKKKKKRKTNQDKRKNKNNKLSHMSVFLIQKIA